MATEYSSSNDFQRKILSLFIREPGQSHSIVEPEYFTDPITQDIARISKQLYDRHSKKDLTLSRETLGETVKSFLGRKRQDIWPEYKRVIKKAFEDDLSDRAIILDNALQFAKERKFRRALVASEKDVNNGNYDVVLKRFLELKNFGVDDDIGIEYRNNIGAERWGVDRFGQIGTFCLPTLDKMMQGGVGAGELALLIAGGKKGKTTLLGAFAAGAMWQGKNAAIATGELSAAKYQKRIDARVTQRTTATLTKLNSYLHSSNVGKEGKRELAKTIDRLRGMQNQMKGRLFIKQWPTGKGRIKDIESWLDRLWEKKEFQADILFVDYIRTFRPNISYEEHRMNIGQTTLDLRGLAIDRQIPVWSAQQINRAALSKERFEQADIAEDISQFWTIDFGIAFCQTEEEAKHGEIIDKRTGLHKPEKARVYLQTARDTGGGGVVEVLMYRDTFTVREAKTRNY
jgi:hypothetical protein